MILTIAIPTYNRSLSLALLLDFLKTEVAGLESWVQVLVSDNASTDATNQVIAQARAVWPSLTIQRHECNIGADANFCSCVDRIKTRHFWILGDDDLPHPGVVAALVALLRAERPDLIFMRSDWVLDVALAVACQPVETLRWRRLERLPFARDVHVWFTFISGIVVNRERLLQVLEGHTIRRYAGTNLVQLGWTFPLLKNGTRFFLVDDVCVSATMGNTGGYALLTVFGTHFSMVCREAFGQGSRLTSVMIDRALSRYLPGLVWASRGASAKRFAAENPWPSMRRELGQRWLFWLMLLPIGHLPRPLAMAVFHCWRVIVRLGKEMARAVASVRSLSRGSR